MQATSPPVTRFVRSSASSLKFLQSLPEACIIVLFTPAIPPMAGMDKKGMTVDPFESFGRAISRRHARVRHVPYVPKVGLTDLHLPWIRQAHAIVVIVCESTTSSALYTPKEENLVNQKRFMLDVANMVHSMRPTDSSLVSMNAVYCGSGLAPQHALYQNVIQGPLPLSDTHLEPVARLLMGH